jgi:hypothetical protein
MAASFAFQELTCLKSFIRRLRRLTQICCKEILDWWGERPREPSQIPLAAEV